MRQFIRFCIVGFSTTAVDFSIYLVLTRVAKLQYLLANLIAVLIAIIWSYYWNRRYTFKSKEKALKLQFSKFFVVSTIGLGLNELILFLLVNFGLNDIFAKMCAVGIVLFWNFFINKFWTFKDVNNQLK